MMMASARRMRPAPLLTAMNYFLLLEGLISFDKERARLQKEIANITSYVSSIHKKLANRGFADNAPPDVIAKEREKLGEAEANP